VIVIICHGCATDLRNLYILRVVNLQQDHEQKSESYRFALPGNSMLLNLYSFLDQPAKSTWNDSAPCGL
jgi:hypothetical protein